MSGTLGHNGTSQTFAALTATVLTTLTAIVDSLCPTSFLINASSKFVIQRPGRYMVSVQQYVSPNNSSANYPGSQIWKNSTVFAASTSYATASHNSASTDTVVRTFVTNDIIQFAGFYDIGSYTTTFLLNDSSTHANNQFAVTEVPTW
jgi:hypothetical protein